MIPTRFRAARRLGLLTMASLALAGLTGCASLGGRERPRVSLVGLEPLPGQGLEWRFLVRLRVVNPNDEAIDFDGLFAALSVRGSEIATGAMGERGSVPRFGESVVAVPMSVTALGLVRPLMAVAGSGEARVPYALRGSLQVQPFGRLPFELAGEFDARSLFDRSAR